MQETQQKVGPFTLDMELCLFHKLSGGGSNNTYICLLLNTFTYKKVKQKFADGAFVSGYSQKRSRIFVIKGKA